MTKYEVRVMVDGSVRKEGVEATGYEWNELEVVFFADRNKRASYNAAMVVSVKVVGQAPE